MLYYTGIGSRETPEEILIIFKKLGVWFANNGYTLRSGGANGADSAFEYGCDLAQGNKEIYLPWKGFNSNSSQLYKIPKEAYETIDLLGRKPKNDFSKKLLARNVLQVLGEDLETPSNIVICFTPDGKRVGGTSIGIQIAEENGIPIVNFGSGKIEDNLNRIKQLVKDV